MHARRRRPPAFDTAARLGGGLGVGATAPRVRAAEVCFLSFGSAAAAAAPFVATWRVPRASRGLRVRREGHVCVRWWMLCARARRCDEGRERSLARRRLLRVRCAAVETEPTRRLLRTLLAAVETQLCSILRPVMVDGSGRPGTPLPRARLPRACPRCAFSNYSGLVGSLMRGVSVRVSDKGGAFRTCRRAVSCCRVLTW